jgi:hypothetical protein
MKLIKLFSKILIASILMLVLITPYSSKAQPEALKSALNEVIQSEENTAIFLKILNLSILETKKLEEKLNNIKDLEEEYLDLKNQFLIKLDEYQKYFQLLKERIEGSLIEEELGNLIDEFKDWRESNYNSEIKKILDFILVFQQKSFLAIAEKRFEKISKDLQKIKLPKGNKIEALNRLLEEAEANLDEAKKFFLTAQVLILPAQNIESTITTTATTTSSTESSLNQTPGIRELIKNAMNKIKDAYQKFFQISVLIKKSK